jgi:hypothetical protein
LCISLLVIVWKNRIICSSIRRWDVGMPFTSVGNSVFLEWNTVKDVECHTGVKDIQISGNIGHKT